MSETKEPMVYRQMTLVAAVLAEMSRQAKAEGYVEPSVLPRHINAVIAGVNFMLEELNKPYRPAVANSGLSQWLCSDGVGASSRYMASVFMSQISHLSPPLTPADPDDFGRCVGLLDAVPEFRSQLDKLTATGPHWAGLVEHWTELEQLYRNSQWKELHERMDLIAAHASTVTVPNAESV